MTEIVEKLHASGFVISEANLNHSRENAVLLSGQNLGAGAVLGRTVTAGTITGSAFAGNTGGSGAIGTLSVGGAAKEGLYRAIIIEPGTNAGIFMVVDPEGEFVGRGTVAVAFASDHVNFTIADATDFVSGDGFDIKVSQLTVKYKVLNPAGTDGSNRAAAVLVDAVDASAADKACVIIARHAEVNGNELTWPGAIAAADKSIAIAQLERRSILVR